MRDGDDYYSVDSTDAVAFGGVGASVAFWMVAWFSCSFVTLFLNKLILSEMGGSIVELALVQMGTTAVLGAVTVLGQYFYELSSRVTSSKPVKTFALHATPHFFRNMAYAGLMRGLCVLLGLLSLSHVALSFTETIKATAPLFTVVFAFLLLGERHNTRVILSLVPVMVGLVLCSETELSFDMVGFIAAMLNNLIDCLANVFSKKLLNNDVMTPAHLQFYTSVVAATLQIPVILSMYYGIGPDNTVDIYRNGDQGGLVHNASLPKLLRIIPKHRDPSDLLRPSMAINGVFFHMQSVTSYFVMSLVSPVTQSVFNTAKRSLLIFLSILYFGNQVTVLNGFGMGIILAGVALFNFTSFHFPPVIMISHNFSRDDFESDAEEQPLLELDSTGNLLRSGAPSKHRVSRFPRKKNSGGPENLESGKRYVIRIFAVIAGLVLGYLAYLKWAGHSLIEVDMAFHEAEDHIIRPAKQEVVVLSKKIAELNESSVHKFEHLKTEKNKVMQQLQETVKREHFVNAVVEETMNRTAQHKLNISDPLFAQKKKFLEDAVKERERVAERDRQNSKKLQALLDASLHREEIVIHAFQATLNQTAKALNRTRMRKKHGGKKFRV
jgi:solute carrier family 35, member E2